MYSNSQPQPPPPSYNAAVGLSPGFQQQPLQPLQPQPFNTLAQPHHQQQHHHQQQQQHGNLQQQQQRHPQARSSQFFQTFSSRQKTNAQISMAAAALSAIFFSDYFVPTEDQEEVTGLDGEQHIFDFDRFNDEMEIIRFLLALVGCICLGLSALAKLLARTRADVGLGLSLAGTLLFGAYIGLTIGLYHEVFAHMSWLFYVSIIAVPLAAFTCHLSYQEYLHPSSPNQVQDQQPVPMS